MKYRLIALDLDRTLLNDQGQVSAQDTRALQQAVQAGMYIVFASGRMSASIRRFSELLKIDGPIISYNGAMARDSLAHGDAVLLEVPLAAKYADTLIDYTTTEHFHLNYYLDETLYAREDLELRRFADLYHARTGSLFTFVPDLARFKGRRPTKLILLTDPSDPAHPNPRHRDELNFAWKEKWGEGVGIVRTDPEYLEFMNLAANKGVALEAIARQLGLPREEVIAVGDGYNDTPMLQWAGLGVAVANAHAEVKAAADYVCHATNNDSPIREILDRFA